MKLVLTIPQVARTLTNGSTVNRTEDILARHQAIPSPANLPSPSGLAVNTVSEASMQVLVSLRPIYPISKIEKANVPFSIGPTCPSDLPAATFTTFDKQSCIPIDVLEVPCDIHNTANNCIWRNGADQCCDKVDCSAAALRRNAAAQRPMAVQDRTEL
jgi:hypothetical protein